MNILLIVLLILLVWRTAAGVKKGIVRETISFVNILFAAAGIGLACMVWNAYQEKELLHCFVYVLIIIVLAVVHSVLKVAFFSAKVVSSLPVISTADKILGLAIGVVETLLLFWILCFAMQYISFGETGARIAAMIQESEILSLLYRCNLLGYLLELIREAIRNAM